uniref:2-ketoglutarate dependent dioxygenase n=1 Tax=Streptomyces luridus TaxID=67320 RepID=D7PC13_STRLR|nr:2-ketoglutarate dependent dioxygenase [Streptomyces luridus]
MTGGGHQTTPGQTLTDGFDAVRVAVAGPLRDHLTSAGESTADAGAARAELAALVGEHLDDGPGVLVLTGLPADREGGERAVLRATRLLGEPLPQNREGTLVREVRDRGMSISQRGRTRYSDSRFGGDLHTDGAEAPLPAPDVFTLFCVRQSVHGGALQCLHVREVERALDPEVLATLRAPFRFDRRGDQEPGQDPTTAKPVLFSQRGRPAITYLRSYIEHGHDHPGVPALTTGQRAALDALDALIASSPAVLTGKLREGELALFDNLSLLHGRTEFQDEPDHTRLLLRTWVRRHSDERS